MSDLRLLKEEEFSLIIDKCSKMSPKELIHEILILAEAIKVYEYIKKGHEDRIKTLEQTQPHQ